MNTCTNIFLGFVLIAGITCSVQAVDYLYPVCLADSEGNSLYVIHQHSGRTTLMRWIKDTKELLPALMATYDPAAVVALPNYQGYCFLHHDRIRIKYLEKRSPQVVTFGEVPLYNVKPFSIIVGNPLTFMVSAEERGFHGVYAVDNRFPVARLLYQQGTHYLYPQYCNNNLFYIRSTAQGYTIERQHLALSQLRYAADSKPDTILRNYDSNDNHTEPLLHHTGETIWNNGTQPIAFLQVISERAVIAIEHPYHITGEVVSLKCFIVEQDDSQTVWKKRVLFTFDIPITLLEDSRLSYESRLYESILPLIPRHYGDQLYYSSCTVDRGFYPLSLYRYDLKNGSHHLCAAPDYLTGSLFAPVLCGTQLYCGGSIGQEGKSIDIWHARDALYADLPVVEDLHNCPYEGFK